MDPHAKRMKIVILRVTEEEKAQLSQIADREDKTVSALIRTTLLRQASRSERKRAQCPHLPSDSD